MQGNIIVLHARDSSKASRITRRKQFSWLYLGYDIQQKERISSKLGAESRYVVGSLLQEIAHQQKKPFLDFIAELGLYQNNKLHWWASNLAYKSTLATDFFLLWCYAVLFEKVVSQNESSSVIVLVEDQWLYRYLCQHHVYKGVRFPSRKNVLPEMLKLTIKGILARAYFIAKATRSALGEKRSVSTSEERSKQIYIYSWIQESFCQENGQFRDAYFGRLPEILTQSGLNLTYIVPHLLSNDLKRKASMADCEFVFLDQHIRFIDILKSAFSRFSISHSTNQQWARTFLFRQTLYEMTSFSSALIYHFAFKRWLKTLHNSDIIIIYPFENQPWEKMLHMAINETKKQVKSIGYQHSTVPSFALSYFLGTDEFKNTPLPNVIVTSGEYTLDLLQNAGYGNTEFVNGGALRYEYLYT